MSVAEQERTRVGRPRVLDETKRREICALVSAGASLKTAAEYVGCSYVTVYRERQRDEEFRRRLARARATRQLAPLQMMRQAAQTHWRAAAWMLERLDPEQFGRRRPQAFGARELRALKRDLLNIFDKAIDERQSREEVNERMQATLNYAMRHAWDRRRTGQPLRRAMRLFDAFNTPKPSDDPWDELERSINNVARASGLTSWANDFERSENPNLSKSTPANSKPKRKTTSVAAGDEPDDVQKGGSFVNENEKPFKT